MEKEQASGDLYKVVRAQIEHLDNTLSQRIVWLILSQSFFVSGYSAAVMGNPTNPAYIHIQGILLVLFPVVSLVLILFSSFDMICGLVYMRKLENYFTKEKAARQFEIGYPPVNGFKMLNGLKNLSTITVPLMLTAFWIYILCIK
jgi:hypothetical protein